MMKEPLPARIYGGARMNEQKHVGIWLPAKLWNAVEFYTKLAGMSKKALVIEAVREYLQRRGVAEYGFDLETDG